MGVVKGERKAAEPASVLWLNDSAHRWRPLRGSRITKLRGGAAIRCSAWFGFFGARKDMVKMSRKYDRQTTHHIDKAPLSQFVSGKQSLNVIDE